MKSDEAIDRTNGREETAVYLSLIIAVLLVTGFFYAPLAKNWFLSDDVQWIWSSATHQFREMFFSPERYRSMASNFTPMLGASFRIDWLLFKMDPAGYYIHSLLSLAAAAAALYFFLRLYVKRNPALFGVLLFLMSPITLSVTSWFSTRHYIEGLFWALLGLTLFVNGERKNRISAASGVCYVLASLNKEVYVVLPAVALLLSTGTVLKRMKYTLPFWLGLAVYTVWRLWIMGGIGGYPSNQPLSSDVILPLLYRIIRSFSSHLFGDYSALFYLFLFPALVLSFRKIEMLLILLVLMVPILPVANILNGDHYTGRYFFHMMVFLICSSCILLARAAQGRWRIFGIGLFLVYLLTAAAFLKRDFDLSKDIRDERINAKESATAFVSSESKYIGADQPSWFYESIRKIDRKFLGREIRTQIVPPAGFLEYADPKRLKDIRESGFAIPYERLIASQKRFEQGPLSVKILIDNYKLTWDFGPDKHVLYTVLRGTASGLYYNQSVLGPSGSIMLGQANQGEPDIVYVKVFYHSEEGKVVVSPEFVLKIPGNEKIKFSHCED